ncbi:putative Ig domain-containing protein [Gimesia panareensis]|nr:putative Ig domain-containing protein [Gimesia panareensis]
MKSTHANMLARTEILETRQLLAADDLTALSDDFESAATLSDWQRIYQTEGWSSDQLETWDINQSQPGRMVLTPYTTVWYQDYRGPMAYKEITGDFVVTTQVHISDRDEIGDSDLDDVPNGSQFSLGGLMIRTPRDITNPEVDWSPGSHQNDGTNNGENYIFLSLGWGNSGNQFQMETKTTRNSNSSLVLQNMGNNSTLNLQIARIGDSVYTLYQIPGENWVLNSRYHRPDLPETLQVGMVAYTDWTKANDYDPFYLNNNALYPGGFDPTPFEDFQPDLVAGFDFIQFDRPEIPPDLQGLDLRTQTTDQQLLSFLGGNVNDPVIPNPGTNTPMQVGMNLEDIADWSAAWTFTDMAHTMRSWNSVSLNLNTYESQWGSTLFDIDLDANGWPTETHQMVNELGQTIIQQYIAPILTGNVNPAGIYRAEWDGEATVLLPGIVEQGLTAEGRHYALLDLAANQDILLTIRDINPADYFRNFNLWMPDYNGQSFAGQDWQPGDDFSPFHPLFLERLAPFETLRFMNWMETNESDIVTWADRAQLSDATYYGGHDPAEFHNGIAPEYMIELSNELDANPWFNMPHQANDDFVRSFAEMVRDTLDPELTVYVEWSNEIWNYAYGFDASQWINEQLALPENAGMNWYEFAASQIQQDFAIWEEVFAGQEDRLVRVVAGQQANPTFLASLLPEMDGQFDAVSVTAYAGLGSEQLAGFDETTTPDDVIDTLLEETIPWSLSRLIDHQNLIDQYSQQLGREIEFVTYEGGSHPDAYGWPAEAAVHEASLSPRMYDVYQTLLNGAQQIGVDLFNQFVFTGGGVSAPWGDWGLLHTMDQPLETSYEYQSILDFINAQSPQALPVVSLQANVDSAQELDTAQLEFTFTRSADQLDQPLTVNYQLAGTATAGLDFQNLTGEISFADDEASVTLVVDILADLIDEADETLEVLLVDGELYDLGETTQASGTIVDNDFTNVAPVASPVSDQTLFETELFALDVTSYFSDANVVDGDQLTLSATLSGGGSLPDWLTFNPVTGTFNGAPVGGDAGSFDIEVTAADLAGSQTSTTFQLTVSPLLQTQLDLRVVQAPTPVAPNGETAALPTHIENLNEWEAFQVEVWAHVINASDTGVAAFAFDLSYNTAYTTATAIEFGPAFTENQTGLIDDVSGLVQGISANTLITDAGDNQFVLLARIHFAPTADDQVSLDFESQSIGPADAGFSLGQTMVDLVNQRPSQLKSVLVPPTQFWAVPYDVNDDDAINFKDLVLFVATYNTNVIDSTLPYAWAMDFNQSGTVNFRDLILLAANYGLSKPSHPELIFDPGYPETWTTQNLVAAFSPQLNQQNIPSLSKTAATETANSVIQAYAASSASTELQLLKETEIEIVDLPDNLLAQSSPGKIQIDVTAAGHGWFIDATPWDHSEFSLATMTELQADAYSAAAFRIDLLTVISHEFEHILGHQHETTGLRKATLSPGIRRLPEAQLQKELQRRAQMQQETDLFFSSLSDESLLAFG